MWQFIDHFDPVQVRYVGFEWRRLIDAIVRVADASSDVILLFVWAMARLTVYRPT